ncbi:MULTISPECIES: polysaccharide lyase family 1 protein [Flavobacterium]|uniref:pectate lyase family protein n=1 Tax=Flavobacterium TaxID=237 RepID=UPI0011835013|nr:MULTISPECIES: pectate lyase [Flavobacterium]MCR4029683.1 pectate lyase [Flavobacterium panacis]
MGNKKIRSCLFLSAFFFISSVSIGSERTNQKETSDKSAEEIDAFPGAEGFGRFTTGGRGGKVLFVTNLNDSGPGSFREAVTAKGKRYVLFKVSGNIALKSRLSINENDLTIAGQTAPGDGICIKDYPVVLNADNIIVRYMRFRMGDAAKQQADALESRFHKNIIVDHCSLSWSSDETASLYANENTTFQWCFVTESLKVSVHEKGSHGYGAIWGGKKASFHHNLLAHHDSRNPRLGESAGTSFALTDLVDVRNNVIYNWAGNSCYGGEAMNVNIVNCYYKPGPATGKSSKIIAIDKNKIPGKEVFNIWGKFYIDGNVVEGSKEATKDNWTYGVYNQFHPGYGIIPEKEKEAMRMKVPHNINNNLHTDTAQQAYEKVLQSGGASLVRDAIDIRIATEVKNGTYSYEGSKGSTKGIIDSQQDVGGWPNLISKEAPIDSSGDGIPDYWKKKKNLDLTKNNPNGHDLSKTYENIEVYINSLVLNN